MAGGLDGKLRKNQAAPIDLQNLARLSEKPHQAADRRHPAGGPDLSGLAAVLQAPVLSLEITEVSKYNNSIIIALCVFLE